MWAHPPISLFPSPSLASCVDYSSLSVIHTLPDVNLRPKTGSAAGQASGEACLCEYVLRTVGTLPFADTTASPMATTPH